MFATRGAIIPLDACIEGEGIDTDVFRKPAVEQVTFAEKMYGIREVNSIQMTMANADLLQESGMTIDDVNGIDWEGMTRVADSMYRRSGGDVASIGDASHRT